MCCISCTHDPICKMANNLRRPHHEHKAFNTLFDKDNLLLFLLVYIIYSVTLYSILYILLPCTEPYLNTSAMTGLTLGGIRESFNYLIKSLIVPKILEQLLREIILSFDFFWIFPCKIWITCESGTDYGFIWSWNG